MQLSLHLSKISTLHNAPGSVLLRYHPFSHQSTLFPWSTNHLEDHRYLWFCELPIKSGMRPANRESDIIASFHLYDTNDKNNYGVVAATIKWGHFFWSEALLWERLSPRPSSRSMSRAIRCTPIYIRHPPSYSIQLLLYLLTVDHKLDLETSLELAFGGSSQSRIWDDCQTGGGHQLLAGSGSTSPDFR